MKMDYKRYSQRFDTELFDWVEDKIKEYKNKNENLNEFDETLSSEQISEYWKNEGIILALVSIKQKFLEIMGDYINHVD